MDLEFATEIPEAHNFQQISGGNNTISCYTDDSKKNDQVGTVVHITEGVNLVKEQFYHLGPNSTVFQAETFALGQTARILREKNTAVKNIIINCDSQADQLLQALKLNLKLLTAQPSPSKTNLERTTMSY